MPATSDPRPLTGEPVSLDLLNTRWMQDGVRQDLLTGVDGLRIWLTSQRPGRPVQRRRRHPGPDADRPRGARRPRRQPRRPGRGRPRRRGARAWAHPRHPHRRRPGRAGGVRRPGLGSRLDRRPRPSRSAALRARPDPRLRARGVRPALLRHLAERHAALVLHGGLRKPREGFAALRAHARGLSAPRVRHTRHRGATACRRVPPHGDQVDPAPPVPHRCAPVVRWRIRRTGGSPP